MAENAFIKIGTALLKHQVKKLVGEEVVGVLSTELAELGGDKLEVWLGDQSTRAEIEKAANTARDTFCGKVNDAEVEQWMVMLPIHDLPAVLAAIEALPISPDETQLESALRETIALNWTRLSPAQVDHAVNAFLSCLRSALLPIEKQTLMVIGRAVLRMEDKLNQLTKLVEQLKPYPTGAQVESRFSNLTVGGNVDGNLVVGDHNVVTKVTNNYYQQVVEKNVEKHEPDYWALKHPYPMPPNFTGRIAERAMLTHWLNEDKENHLFILRALGGFGKSALAWHWLTHDVDSQAYPKVLWWSFYEGDASFEHFTAETLKYLNHLVPQSKREQVDELLKALQTEKVLLVMDGFERALRAYGSLNAAYQGDEEPKLDDNQYDCVDLNAELFLKSLCSWPKIPTKVLMTTRLTPRTVKPRGECMLGCRETELTAMQKADAVMFFQKQKINGTHAEIEAACEPYGFHPLSLRILAGLIVNNRETPNDIKVAEKIDITEDIIQNKNHVLRIAYDSLSFDQQKLLSNIACLRSSTTYRLLKYISSKPSWKRKNKSHQVESLDSSLRTLEAHGLLTWDRNTNVYALHPIVKRYAYHRLTSADCRGAHERLVDYFEAVPPLANVKTLEDLAPVIELYHHLVRAGNLDEAVMLFYDRLNKPLYYQFGAYQIFIELQSALLDEKKQLPRVSNEGLKSRILNDIGGAYAMSGQPRNVVLLLERAINLDEARDDKQSLVIRFGNVATQQLVIGALSAAERNLRRSIDLGCEIPDEFNEAIGYLELGPVLSYRGTWQEAEQELDKALELAEKQSHVQMQGVTWLYRTLHFLLMAREFSNQPSVSRNESQIENLKLSIECAQRALELADEQAKKIPVPRDYVRAYWLLGAAYRANHDLTLAEENLSKALNLCRQINNVESEADILLELARLSFAYALREAPGSAQDAWLKDAQEKASEALLITERSGYILQGADVNLFLAQYALEQEQDKAKAKQYAETALKLATCDGPPYYYKVAYEEAERLLEKLGSA